MYSVKNLRKIRKHKPIVASFFLFFVFCFFFLLQAKPNNSRKTAHDKSNSLQMCLFVKIFRLESFQYSGFLFENIDLFQANVKV